MRLIVWVVAVQAGIHGDAAPSATATPGAPRAGTASAPCSTSASSGGAAAVRATSAGSAATDAGSSTNSATPSPAAATCASSAALHVNQMRGLVIAGIVKRCGHQARLPEAGI